MNKKNEGVTLRKFRGQGGHLPRVAGSTTKCEKGVKPNAR